ncbi:hypothetical protein OIU76_007741 [Salix suchowensis]|nr:hypothetical protein OIU78_011695 [Salix suchowensis]KAJ6338122.1 hypothetical protein OIU76_007741 [Salix suchowensis]
MSINIVKETEDELADFQALFSYLSPNSKANSEATSNGKGGRSYDMKSGGAKKLKAEVERLKLENEKIVQKTRFLPTPMNFSSLFRKLDEGGRGQSLSAVLFLLLHAGDAGVPFSSLIFGHREVFHKGVFHREEFGVER